MFAINSNGQAKGVSGMLYYSLSFGGKGIVAVKWAVTMKSRSAYIVKVIL